MPFRRGGGGGGSARNEIHILNYTLSIAILTAQKWVDVLYNIDPLPFISFIFLKIKLFFLDTNSTSVGDEPSIQHQ